MPPSPPGNERPDRLDFGPYSLDPRSGELWRDGSPVRLAALPARVLRYLAVNRSRTVPKSELISAVWSGLHVEESTVRQAIRTARTAVGDDGRRQQVIASASGVGYRFVAEIRGELPTKEQLDCSDYVGQSALIARLRQSITDLSNSHPRLLLLSGEPGIGKSRAVDELTRFGWARGVPVVRGGSNAPDGASAFWPWIEAFRELSGFRNVEALRTHVPHLLGLDPGGTRTLGAPDRFRAAAAALRCLEDGARFGPLVVVLEDLHQSGAAAIELLEFVLTRIGRAPLLLVATYRDLELRSKPACEEALARLIDRPGATCIPIEPLSEVETAYLVEQRSGQKVPVHEIPAIADYTGCNPFFAIELSAHLRMESPAEEEARSLWIDRNAGKALSERLARIDPAVRSILTVASVCGTSFDRAVVARAVGHTSMDHALRVAIRERVINEPRRGQTRFRFAHALVRDALYDELSSRSRECQSLHLRIAEVILELHPDEDVQAAHHICAAAPLAGARRIVRYVERAARRAARGGDLETAATLYDRALEALERVRSPALSARLRILVAAGELGVRCERATLDLARSRLDEALDALRRRDEPELFARAALARAYRTEIVGIADGQILELLAEAISKLGASNPALSAQLRSRRAIESRYCAGEEVAAHVAVETAVREARSSGDARALARVLEDASLVRWSVPDPEAWLRLNEEIVEAATRAHDTELLFQGLKGIATAHLEFGDRDGFEREIARCAALAEDYPSPFLKAVVACFDGARCFLDGDFASAEQNAILAASSGLDSISPLAAGQIFYHRRELGRLGELEGAVRQFIESSPGIAMWPIALTRLLVDSGRTAEARHALAGIQPIDTIARDRNWLPTLIVLAESAVLLEDRGLCEQIHEALRPYARVHGVLGNGSLYLGQTAHYLGTLALVLERWQEAEAHLEQAARAHASMRSEPWCLRTASEQVHLARSRGSSAQIRSVVEQISGRARALGMIRCAERAGAVVS